VVQIIFQYLFQLQDQLGLKEFKVFKEFPAFRESLVLVDLKVFKASQVIQVLLVPIV
jgi:hypothetical protein